jgi:hypothetical protein
MIHRVIELRDQIDPAIGVRGEVLDVVAKNLIIADNRKDVIERVDRRHEQTDFFDRAGHAPGSDEITGIVAFTSLADCLQRRSLSRGPQTGVNSGLCGIRPP